MKPKLYVFGCSYSTGEELLLDEIQQLNQLRLDTAHDPRIFFHALEKDIELSRQYQLLIDKQKILSWPNLLAGMMDIECVNLAESGNSLDKMLYQISITEFNSNDVIIVALTNPYRSMYFSDTAKSFQLPSLVWPVKDRLLGVSVNGNLDYVIGKEEDKAVLKWFNDDRVMWDQIKNLSMLGYLQKSLNLFVVPAMSRKTFELKNYNCPVLPGLYNDLEKTLCITDKNLDDFILTRMPWGHPDKLAHSAYAEHCYEILRQL